MEQWVSNSKPHHVPGDGMSSFDVYSHSLAKLSLPSTHTPNAPMVPARCREPRKKKEPAEALPGDPINFDSTLDEAYDAEHHPTHEKK